MSRRKRTHGFIFLFNKSFLYIISILSPTTLFDYLPVTCLASCYNILMFFYCIVADLKIWNHIKKYFLRKYKCKITMGIERTLLRDSDIDSRYIVQTVQIPHKKSMLLVYRFPFPLKQTFATAEDISKQTVVTPYIVVAHFTHFNFSCIISVSNVEDTGGFQFYISIVRSFFSYRSVFGATLVSS